MKVYFFVDGDGTENVSNFLPRRHPSEAFWVVEECVSINGKATIRDALTELPRGTVKTLFGRELTWDDLPIKIDYSQGDAKISAAAG